MSALRVIFSWLVSIYPNIVTKYNTQGSNMGDKCSDADPAAKERVRSLSTKNYNTRESIRSIIGKVQVSVKDKMSWGRSCVSYTLKEG